MPIPVGLLLATLAVSEPRPATPIAARAVVASQSVVQDDPTAPAASDPRPHQVGIGGFGGSGGGPSLRWFFGDRTGFDLNVGWYLPPGTQTNGRGASFLV